MAVERVELRMVRESLEAVLAPEVVSSVMFQALLEVGGALPEGPEAAGTWVDGPLRDALRARIGDDADPTIDHITQMLSRVPGATPPRGASRELEITREVVLDARPVLVFVVASDETFASQLLAALGSSRVTSVPCTTLEGLHKNLRIGVPHIVLVDAAEFAPIEPDDLAQALESIPVTTVRAIWGADLPFGASVLRALVARKIPATPIDRREGIEPLLDLIRSRQIAKG